MTGFRGLPRTYWTLWLGTLVNRLGGFVVPFLALYLTRERNMSETAAGLMLSLYGAGAVAAGPIGGVLADRVGRRPTMLLGLAGGAAGMLALGLARTPVEIASAALALGFISELYRPAVFAAVADLVAPADRLRAYAYLYWAVNLGFSLAPLVAGLMARRSYFALFAADAATTLVYAVIVWRGVPETRPAAARTAGQGHGGRGGLRVVFTDPVFMAFLGLTFLTGVVFQQGGVAFSLDLRAHGLTETDYGVAIALNGILIVLVQPIATRYVQHARRSQVLAAAAALIGLGFGMNALVGTLPLYMVGVAIWTMGEIIGTPASSSIVADLSPAALRGRYQDRVAGGGCPPPAPTPPDVPFGIRRFTRDARVSCAHR